MTWSVFVWSVGLLMSTSRDELVALVAVSCHVRATTIPDGISTVGSFIGSSAGTATSSATWVGIDCAGVVGVPAFLARRGSRRTSTTSDTSANERAEPEAHEPAATARRLVGLSLDQERLGRDQRRLDPPVRLTRRRAVPDSGGLGHARRARLGLGLRLRLGRRARAERGCGRRRRRRRRSWSGRPRPHDRRWRRCAPRSRARAARAGPAGRDGGPARRRRPRRCDGGTIVPASAVGTGPGARAGLGLLVPGPGSGPEGAGPVQARAGPGSVPARAGRRGAGSGSGGAGSGAGGGGTGAGSGSGGGRVGAGLRNPARARAPAARGGPGRAPAPSRPRGGGGRGRRPGGEVGAAAPAVPVGRRNSGLGLGHRVAVRWDDRGRMDHGPGRGRTAAPSRRIGRAGIERGAEPVAERDRGIRPLLRRLRHRVLDDAHTASGTPRRRRSGTGALAMRPSTAFIPSSEPAGNAGCAREHREQRRAERVHVGCVRRAPTLDHLGCGVQEADRRRARLHDVEQAGKAEIREARLPRRRDEHVLGADVAVLDACRVRDRERVRELGDDRHRLGPRHPTVPLDAVGERAVRHVVHGQVRLVDGREAGGEQRHEVRLGRHRPQQLALPGVAAAERGLGPRRQQAHRDRCGRDRPRAPGRPTPKPPAPISTPSSSPVDPEIDPVLHCHDPVAPW